eukprot:CAMPEP_0185024586 /NCGR_PEP_ID=MMETSP1103-20130426/7716_1 /TAXON_ID=36769 /ORGANISM="Paraphysomonas bandaiensis, Strain Caron Lab Isolate" /LENGTH=561 /DNA_ID=CAMNT_0027557601 /DNA_START=46 /DNA_END=1728 /DNA_ORIENTATION=+
MRAPLSSLSAVFIYLCLCVSASYAEVSTRATSRLIREQVEAYKSIAGTDKLTFDSLMKLLKLHDSDTVCEGPCVRYMSEIVNGNNGLEWTYLERLLDTLYGDMISDDPYQPQEVHISLTDSLTEMKVMWASMDKLIDPFVEYTADLNDWCEDTTIAVPAVDYTYSVPQNWYPAFAGVLYEANMVDLIPGKKQYRYRVGGYDPVNSTIRRSKDFMFSSSPEPNPDQKTTFATFGDQGTFMLLGFSTSNKLKEIQDEVGVDIVHYAGDLCYAGLSGDLTPFNDVDEDDEFGHIWDLWGIQTEPVAATRPFMTTPGNHEGFYNWTAFTHRYKMPVSENSNGSFWFSYDYGNVHMVSISTEECVDPDCPQMVWLESDLQRAVNNRKEVPWIVLSLHRPIYCSDESQYDSHSPGGKYQQALEPLMLKYDVDLVLQGHLHAYERVHPVNNGEVTSHPTTYPEGSEGVDMYRSTNKGPVYVVQGNTGAMQVERWVHPQPRWSAKRFANGYIPPRNAHTADGKAELEGLVLDSNYTDTFGFGIATFSNSTHLHYSVVPVTGSIGTDEFW